MIRQLQIFILLVTSALLPASSSAELLVLSFEDPPNDRYGSFPVEVIDLSLSFDNATGEYKATLTATNENPFIGAFRINLNLFNPDTGTRACDPSFFQDTVNDFNLTVPTRTILLEGQNPRLTAWAAGHHVASQSVNGGLGNPDCSSLFRSAVGDGGFLTNEDMIGDSEFAVAVIEPESPPAPCTLDQTVSYGDGTLDLNYSLGNVEPANWKVWIILPGYFAQLFAVPLPVLDPPVNIPLSFPFPQIGPIGLLTVLDAPGLLCADLDLVDTGS